MAVLVYVVALGVGWLVAVRIYRATARLRRHGAPGCWLSRCLAGIGASVSFVVMFLVTGTGVVLSRTGEPPSWSEGLAIAVIMGVVYATVWPVAERLHDSNEN